MLIKSADEKTPDIDALTALLARTDIMTDTRKKIEQEIRNIQSGAAGEREAAYEIEFHYGPSKNWAIIHDLRLEHDGRVAQIDHLIINRFLDIYVCESKRFGEGIAINEHGECSAFYAGKPYGVPSPFEQNRKHIIVLKSVLDSGAVQLPSRLGFAIKPDIRSLVVVSKHARISRPKAKAEGPDEIVKSDQIRARIDKQFDNDNNIHTAAKIIGSDTLEDFAKRLAAAHRPASFDWAAKFGLPKVPPKPASPPVQIIREPEAVAEPKAEESGKPKPKLACTTCGTIVTYNVAKFCWFNKARFGGNVYCIDCQKGVQPQASA